MPAVRREPVLVAKPEVHIIRTLAPSSTGSTASSLSCYYRKAVGHSVKDCSQLSTRLCQDCGLFGHTEACCPMLRLICDDIPTTEIFEAYYVCVALEGARDKMNTNRYLEKHRPQCHSPTSRVSDSADPERPMSPNRRARGAAFRARSERRATPCAAGSSSAESSRRATPI